MASTSEMSSTKGSDSTDGDNSPGEISIDDEMPPMHSDSEVVTEAAVDCDCKVLSDGGTSGFPCKTACHPCTT